MVSIATNHGCIYRSALDVRQLTDKIEMDLMRLAEKTEDFVTRMQRVEEAVLLFCDFFFLKSGVDKNFSNLPS